MSFAQVQVCLGTDANVCQGQTVQITNCAGSGGGSTGSIYLNAPTSVAGMSDDNWSSSIPIGFPFSYYGNTYNNLVIGSNGLLSFNLANAGSYCPWSLTGTPLPLVQPSNMSQTINSAMLVYEDLNPANWSSGPIQYQLIGTAPNRMFVVLYNGVTMFSCTNSCAYIGIVLRESSNIVEMFVGSKGTCNSWNGGLAIQGTENTPGNMAHITPGRNNTVWTATQDGRRWTPASPMNTSSYTITTIPYVNINGPSGALQWKNSLGQTFPYNNGVLNINQVPPGSTDYWLTGTSCGVAVGSVSDTTRITRTNVAATATATTDFCGGGSGTATATPTSSASFGPYTYTWTPSGQTTQTATGLVTGTHQVVVTSAAGCTATVSVVVPNTTATFSGTSTPVSCPGGSNGTATASMTPQTGSISYLWNDPAAQTTQTATGLAAGTYTCTVTSSSGCLGTVVVTVTEIPPMAAQIVTQQPPSCNSGSNGIIAVNVNAGTPNYSYSWNNSASTSNSANDLAAGTHTVTITDQLGCVTSLTAALSQPPPLAITALTPDTVICPENNIVLAVTGTGGSTAYTYTWTENGAPIGTGPAITVDPDTSGSVYCVTLSEACGSPTTDSCVTITFPTPIVPSFIPDQASDCQPGTFVFNNTSNNLSDIASVFLEFGDGNDTLLTGSAGTPHTYQEAQIYDLKATVTSVRGCVTFADFDDLVEVIAKPEADFNFSSNPTTYFETTITMQDKSSAGVVAWQWSSLASEPAVSAAQNPVFTFPEGVVGTYTVQLVVTTVEGCTDTTEKVLTVNSDILFFAPTAFTPDGDEFNQTWDFSVIGVDAYNFELVIFNRWGEIVWETHDVNASWDGTYNGQIVPSGGYSWVARVKALDNDAKKTFTGSFSKI